MNYLQIFANECLGTFVFLSVIYSVVKQNIQPFPIGLVLMCVIYAFPESGGHFNPAVSLMDFTAVKMEYLPSKGHISTFPMALLYISGQIVGSQMALFVTNYLLHKERAVSNEVTFEL